MSDAEEKIRDAFGDYPAPENAEIGEGCVFEFKRHSFQKFLSERQPGLRLGKRVVVHMWTAFGTGPNGLITVGDDSILVGAQFMCDDEIRIGRNVIISYNVTIADSDFHPLDPDLRRQDAIAISPQGNASSRPARDSAPVIIEDDATIGIGAIILKGVHIGSGANVGPGAVVTRDVPAGTTVVGNPAVILKDES
jgi:acetyltransferase-like isoleucine patch superfamily enzyme